MDAGDTEEGGSLYQALGSGAKGGMVGEEEERTEERAGQEEDVPGKWEGGVTGDHLDGGGGGGLGGVG